MFYVVTLNRTAISLLLFECSKKNPKGLTLKFEILLLI